MSRKFLLLASLMTALISISGFSTGVQQAKALVTFYIRSDGSVDPPTAPISTIDNMTYSFTGNIFNRIIIERDNITINGSGYTLQGAGPGPGQHGINMTDRYNVTIKNVIIDNFDMGISAQDSRMIVISQNIIQNNAQTGIFLYRASNISVIDNRLINDWRGLGIYLISTNNTISGNLIKDNSQCGVRGANAGNRYYGNNFQNNTAHVSFQNHYSDDFWDNGIEGNYWDTYTGKDTDNDGIGNSPYYLDMYNQDFYPLMGMFTGFQATPEHRVEVVSNSTLSNFQFNSTALSLYVTGFDTTSGFCRVKIPTALMNNTYQVFVNGTEIMPSPEPLPCSTTTNNYIYFNYSHSIQEVIIIPEFPSTILLLSMTAIILAVVAQRRKHST